MNLLWGVILTVFTLLLCWLAQVINALSPVQAAKLGLAEPEADVDPVYYVDGRGEAIWDACILWTLPAAGLLLLVNSPWWVYFGLIGGRMYLYFAGRQLVVRTMMSRRGVRIGTSTTIKVYNAVLALWGLIAVTTIVMAIRTLSLP